MIIAITGTPGTGKTEAAKALSKKLGWPWFSLNEIAEKKKLYSGYDRERMANIVDIASLRQEVEELSLKHKNIIIESHYSHEMPSDIVFVLRTDPKTLRKRMVKKGFHEAKVKENMEAEITDVIKGEAEELGRVIYEFDTTKRTPLQTAEEMRKAIQGQTFISKDIVIPEGGGWESLRFEFKKAHGEVLRGEWREILKKLRKVSGTGPVIVVGDFSAFNMIKSGIIPDVIIVDGKEKRQEFNKKIVFKHPSLKVKNPPGTITVALWRAVEKAVNSKGKFRIDVDGEEDLAVLPCMILAKEGSNIFYGMPDVGLVWVRLDKEKKKEAHSLLETVIFFQT